MQLLERVMTWLKRRERTGLACGVALQIGLLAWMVVAAVTSLSTGKAVRLKVQHSYVRSNDLWPGDHLYLIYDFEQIPAEGIDGIPLPSGRTVGWDRLNRNHSYNQELRKHRGRTVYLTLLPDDDGIHMRPGRMSVEKPRAGPFLTGQIGSWGQIDFGIDTFDLTENNVRKYRQASTIYVPGSDRPQNEYRLTAVVIVDKNGRGRLRDVEIPTLRGDEATAVGR